MLISIESPLKQLFPDMMLGYVQAGVTVEPSTGGQQKEMQEICEALSSGLTPEAIRITPAVEAAKKAYRKMGKDPNRYRPSAESLLRRLASGKGLYHLNNVVDLLNLVSVQTGFSICGYDDGMIHGPIRLGIGNDEPYEGIGRGILNIENLPVFRDDTGAFGTPTSDSVRIMITENTRSVLMIFPVFYPDDSLDDALSLTQDYLVRYARAADVVTGKTACHG